MKDLAVLVYDIPKEFKVSTNKIYAGIHWTKRKKIADFYHYLTTEDCEKLSEITKKVKLHFRFYWKSRTLDSSNCSFMAKCLEDGLVKNGLLKNDTNKFVGKFTIESVEINPKTRKEIEGDYCSITVRSY